MRNKLLNYYIIRVYDIAFSLLALLLLFPLIIFICLICFLDSGKPIFIQKRLGLNKKIFYIFKFRTMKLNTPSISTHLINRTSLTKSGRIIRLLKFDELPQLINVLIGDMSLIGPRPCLLNQKKLISQREKYSIFSVKPGITGLAQINGIDMSNPEELVKYEYKMIKNFNQIKYFRFLFFTLYGKGIGDKIKDN
tara:strand:+ start:1592 stop:2173 length:582 start_codon:yes stop_codon:yes gene_type:complete